MRLLRPSLRSIRTACVASLIVTGLLPGGALSAESSCFSPTEPSSERDTDWTVLNNELPVCRAVLKALNRRCQVTTTLCSIRELGSEFATGPKWKTVPLYNRRGNEVANGFGLIGDLIRARRVTGDMSQETLVRAEKEASIYQDRVRQWHKLGLRPRLETTLVDVGTGSAERVYQLWPMTCPADRPSLPVKGYPNKQDPLLLLHRTLGALKLTPIDARKGDFGQEVALTGINGAELFLWKGAPYLLDWSDLNSIRVLHTWYAPMQKQLIPLTDCLIQYKLR